MKKVIILSVIISFVFWHCSGQDTSRASKQAHQTEDDGDVPDEEQEAPFVSMKKKYQSVIFGLEGGLNISRLNFNNYYEGYNYTIKNRTAARAGILLDIRVANPLYIETGLLYAMNGVRGTFTNSYTTNSETVNINTLELPIGLLFRSKDKGYGSFLAGGGAFLGYNLSGTDKNTNERIQSGKLQIGNMDTDHIRRLDAGLHIHAGYQFSNGVFLRVQYQRGLNNLSPLSGTSDASIYSQSYGVNIGYYLRAKRLLDRIEYRDIKSLGQDEY